MKRLFSLLVLATLALKTVAAEPLARLSTQDAQRLEAIVLSENLLDFAARAGSARAYLMAAELRLEYPVKRQGQDPGEFVRQTVERAVSLAPGDEFTMRWAERLEKLNRKVARNGPINTSLFEISLEPDNKLEMKLEPRRGQRWIALRNRDDGQPGAFRIRLLDPQGQLLTETTEPWISFESDQPVMQEILQTRARLARCLLIIE